MFSCRWVGVAALVGPVLLGSVACSSGDDGNANADDVTTVPESTVKDQSTDNCWIYATTGWVESLHLGATGETLDLSESYLTYWNYFDQIVAGEVTGGMVEEGGSWGEAADKILSYGMINQADFIPSEAGVILSKPQAAALKAIDKALKDGDLRTGAARRNRALVRATLDKAFKLSPAMIAQLDAVFGKDVSKTLDKDYATAALPAGVAIKKASDFKANLKNPITGNIDNVSVLNAMGTHKATNNLEHRNGAYAWQDVAYPKSATDRRNFLIRVQRALNDHMPVVINWTVDFAALTADGRFPDVPTGPDVAKDQGGHVTLGFDYAVDNVPGFGSLEAGIQATPAQLAASLDPQAQVRFLRTKNSWSADYHNLPAPAPAGYDDLYMKYLNGPMKMCDTDANDKVIESSCAPGIPLDTIVLPAGY